MANLAPFCTCSATNCPNHPTNHDQGCTLCIIKNLKRGEIPGCFFNQVDASYPGPDYYYADFARLVAEKQGCAGCGACEKTEE